MLVVIEVLQGRKPDGMVGLGVRGVGVGGVVVVFDVVLGVVLVLEVLAGVWGEVVLVDDWFGCDAGTGVIGDGLGDVVVGLGVDWLCFICYTLYIFAW